MKIQAELRKLADKEKAKLLQRFFKTGKGEYGEGDIFLGVVVPNQRKIVKQFWKETSLNEIQELLNSRIHEERLTGLLILVQKYKKSDLEEKTRIFDFYLKNKHNINNWDLVDLSAPNIVGDFLINLDKSILYNLAKSDNLWSKRISIIATAAFIRNNQFKDTIKISEILLKDSHDLIHKAVGWMLREIGKRNQEQLEIFLRKHYKDMPRTMLRYSIERLEENKRLKYLNSEI